MRHTVTYNVIHNDSYAASGCELHQSPGEVHHPEPGLLLLQTKVIPEEPAGSDISVHPVWAAVLLPEGGGCLDLLNVVVSYVLSEPTACHSSYQQTILACSGWQEEKSSYQFQLS